MFAGALAVAGCSAFEQTMDDWFGGGGPEPTAAPAASASGTFYSGIAGLPVYEGPSSSNRVVGHLGLYERVRRTRLERGYAEITADRGGLSGWVDNARLLWRPPATPAAGAPTPSPAGSPSSAAAATPAANDVAPAAAAEAAPQPPTATAPATEESTPTGTPVPRPTQARGEPAVFDPF